MLEGASTQEAVMGRWRGHSGKLEGASGEGHRFRGGVKGGGRTDPCSSGAGAGCSGAAGNPRSSRSQHSLLLPLVAGGVVGPRASPKWMFRTYKTFGRGWDVAGNGTCPGQLVLLNGEGWSRALEPCLPSKQPPEDQPSGLRWREAEMPPSLKKLAGLHLFTQGGSSGRGLDPKEEGPAGTQTPTASCHPALSP